MEHEKKDELERRYFLSMRHSQQALAATDGSHDPQKYLSGIAHLVEAAQLQVQIRAAEGNDNPSPEGPMITKKELLGGAVGLFAAITTVIALGFGISSSRVTDLSTRVSNMETRLGQIETRLSGDIDDVKGDLRADLARVETNVAAINSDVSAMRADIARIAATLGSPPAQP